MFQLVVNIHIREGGEVKKIIVNRKKEIYALVDNEDFEKLKCYRYYLKKKRGQYIVYRFVDNKCYKVMRLSHDVISDFKIGYEIHHVNRNALDNRKKNLEILSSRQHANTKFNNSSNIHL